MKTALSLLSLRCSCTLISSCNQDNAGGYKVDAVTFVAVAPPPAAGPHPNVHIDANMKMRGISGGTIEAIAPCSLGIDYTDEAFTYAGTEFTKVVVSCDDGTHDPGAASLKLPLHLPARPCESVTGWRVDPS